MKTILFALLAVSALASVSMAQPMTPGAGGTPYMGCDEWGTCFSPGTGAIQPGMGGMMRPGEIGALGMSGYYQPDIRRFLDDTQALRRELHAKRFEYFEEVRRPDVNPDAISRLERDINRLMTELYTRAPMSLKSR